ncbi:unnamed protein product, partial [Meganyctiphanes norvegica]
LSLLISYHHYFVALIEGKDLEFEISTPKSCPHGFILIGGECLLIDNLIHANYSEAGDICQIFDSYLVDLTDANLLAAIVQYITLHDMTGDSYWTGARSVTGGTTWQWSFDDSDVRLGTPLWGDRNSNVEQDPSQSLQHCGTLRYNRNFYLHNYGCTNLFSPICHYQEYAALKTRTPKVECEFPYAAIGGRCLLVDHLTFDTWSNTKLLCEDFHGTIAKIDDANLLGDIAQYINEMGFSQNSYWIGAHQETHGDPWMWADGSNVTMGTPYWGDDSDEQQYPLDDSLKCAILDEGEYYFFVNKDCNANYG